MEEKKVLTEEHIPLIKQKIKEAGGSSVALYGFYGDSDTGGLTQRFLSEKLNNTVIAIGEGTIPNAGSNNISIGHDSKASGSNTVALGWEAQATAMSGVALGAKTKATTGNSVALGYGSYTSREDEVSIGGTSSRYLTGLKAGAKDNDAVNVKQMQDYVAEHAGGGSGPTTAKTLKASGFQQLDSSLGDFQLNRILTNDFKYAEIHITAMNDSLGGSIKFTLNDVPTSLSVPLENPDAGGLGRNVSLCTNTIKICISRVNSEGDDYTTVFATIRGYDTYSTEEVDNQYIVYDEGKINGFTIPYQAGNVYYEVYEVA